MFFDMPVDTLYEDRKVMIDFSTEDYYGTLNIQNAVINKFAFGGYIAEDIKNGTSRKLKQNNRLGGETYTQLNFYDFKTKLFKKERLGYYLGIGYRNFVSGNITQDLFNLAMYGNQNYLNQTMDLNNTRFQNFSYYKLNIGVFDKKYKSGGNLSFIYGNKFMKGELYNAELYADEDIVNLKANGKFSMHDQQKNKQMSFNGWGISADFNINLPIDWFKRKAIIQIKGENIGFISWNKNSTTYQVDSSYSFQGFEISDLLNGNSAVSNETNWLDTLNVQETKGRVTTWIPARITIAKIVDELSDAKFQTTFGVRMITTKDYFPMVFFGVYYRPIDWFAFSATLRYGGFGSLDGGIRIDFYAKKMFAVTLSTANIYGSFANKGYGRSVNIGIRGYIK
jgi:hypothetical protein